MVVLNFADKTAEHTYIFPFYRPPVCWAARKLQALPWHS